MVAGGGGGGETAVLVAAEIIPVLGSVSMRVAVVYRTTS